jgi:hypothetical protein
METRFMPLPAFTLPAKAKVVAESSAFLAKAGTFEGLNIAILLILFSI